MSIINLDKASLAFGHHLLLENVTFAVEEKEKIGIIGRNGEGKSSLLKVIAGDISLDQGIIAKKDGLQIYYVAQEPILNLDATIFEQMLTPELAKLLIPYQQLLQNMDNCDLDQFNHLGDKIELLNGWDYQNRVLKYLSQLNIDPERKIATLSGGMRKKISLVQALIANPDLMLLDEPTNHLDISTISWLENVLQSFTKTIIMISHDRRFLSTTVNKIIELDRAKISTYPGNFTQYQENKAIQIAVETKEKAEFDKFLAQEEVWIRKGIEARRTRNEGRVRRLQELRKLRISRRDTIANPKLELDAGNSGGKIIAELKGVNKSFAQKTIVNNFSTVIRRGDKIALVGDNGVGKSTLLKLILGELAPDSGNVKLANNLQIAYFDQLRQSLDLNLALQDVVAVGSDYVEINNKKRHIASYLEDFLFEPARFRSPVSSLSGGERNRLLLASLFAKPANVLVLDEPTNDLDIITLELLEELLAAYKGTVLIVSHDRDFLDNVVSSSLLFETNGKITEIFGGYSDCEEYSKTKNNDSLIIKTNINSKKITTPKNKNNSLSKNKFTLENLNTQIAQLEQEQSLLQKETLLSNFYQQSPEIIKIHQQKLITLEQLLLEKFNLWEQLVNQET